MYNYRYIDNPTFSESDIFRITVPLNELYSFDMLESNEPIKMILDIISEEPHLSKECIADKIGKSRATVTRALAKLQNDGIIRRVGSNKTGHWEIIKHKDSL